MHGNCWGAGQPDRAATAACCSRSGSGTSQRAAAAGWSAPRQARLLARTEECVGHGVCVVALAGLARHHEHAAAALNLLLAGRNAAAGQGPLGCGRPSCADQPAAASHALQQQRQQQLATAADALAHVLQLHARAAQLPDLSDVGAALAQDRANLRKGVGRAGWCRGVEKGQARHNLEAASACRSVQQHTATRHAALCYRCTPAHTCALLRRYR